MNITTVLSISSTPCTDKEDTVSVTTPCCVPNYEEDTSSSFASIHSVSESEKHPFVEANAENKAQFSSADLTTTEFSLQTTTEDETLAMKGYKRNGFISKTLQGEVFIAKRINGDSDDAYVVVKKANRTLHQNGIAMTTDDRSKVFRVKENIFTEAMIMKRFRAHHPPKSCIKYHAFFWDEKDFYLVMEKAGKGLFEFTVECHEWIKRKKLTVQKWSKYVALIFTQMVECMQWLHGEMHCCHLDISLENVCIGNDTYFDEKEGEIKNLEIRLIDFGLSELFTKKNEFSCNRFVGKNGYKSPQIYEKREFQANKADIWSLGVTLFMMIIGAPPYQVPSVRDGAFKLIINGGLKKLLSIWCRSEYMDSHLEDLLSKMLCYDESQRIDIGGVANHIWLNE